MTTTLRELFDIVAAGDDLAAQDAAFLCQRLDPFLWRKALIAAGKSHSNSDEGEDSPPTPMVPQVAQQQQGKAGEQDDALDAARFRALMRCGRIKPQGSAGVDAKTGERTYPEQPGRVHFGAEFWVQPEAEPSNMTIWGRHCLRALADDILALEASPTPSASLTKGGV